MSFDGDHLLKRLQPVIGIGRVASTDGRSSGAAEGEFARIIRLANDGTLDSGRVVDVDRRFTLDAEQLAGIGRACDSLESAGLDDGIVLLGGRAFVVEVSERKIMDETGLRSDRSRADRRWSRSRRADVGLHTRGFGRGSCGGFE